MHGKLVDKKNMGESVKMWKDMLRIKNYLGEVFWKREHNSLQTFLYISSCN